LPRTTLAKLAVMLLGRRRELVVEPKAAGLMAARLQASMRVPLQQAGKPALLGGSRTTKGASAADTCSGKRPKPN
jgi:hypothetical protein